jgi:hypothetical protein
MFNSKRFTGTLIFGFTFVAFALFAGCSSDNTPTGTGGGGGGGSNPIAGPLAAATATVPLGIQSAPAGSGAAHGQTTVLRSVGLPQTGPNSLCGLEIWSLNGVPSGPESHGAFLGIKDKSSGATEAIPIGLAQCGPAGDPDVLLATNYDDAFGAVRGWVTPSVELENLTFRSVPVPAGNGVYAPIPFPGSVPPNPLPPTISEPTTPVTLGIWRSVGGDLEITCESDGTAFVASSMHDLIGHGVYTMWGQWVDPAAELTLAPFGGMPNVVVADADGNAEFCRELVYCPMDLAPDASELQYLTLMYMGAGGATFGAVPYEAITTRAFVGIASLPFQSSIPGGIVSFDHLAFRINATGGVDPGPSSPAMCLGPPPAVAGVPMVIGADAMLRRSATDAGQP